MAAHPSDVNQHGPGINRISVTGFKSLATKTDLEIRPLTVLAGANSSGKSSFMQPLLLMKQTLESDFNAAGPFLLSGPYLQYTGTRQFLTRPGGRKGSSKPLILEFSFNAGLNAGMAYSTEPEAGLGIVETWGSNGVKNTKWKIARNSTPEELRAMLLELGSIPLLMEQVGFTQVSVQDSGFYQSILYSAPEPPGRRRGESYFMHENLELSTQIRRIIYVPGVRGGQNRRWLLAEITEHGFFVGPFDRYVPSLVDSWQDAGDGQRTDELEAGLQLLGLASGIATMKVNESEIEVRVPLTPGPSEKRATGPRSRQEVELSFEVPASAAETLESALELAMKRGARDREEALAHIAIEYAYADIADVGLAVSTVLPVLVALIQADPGQLVYIEQPELHLHPRAQLKLAQLLAGAANRGVRLVVETHSSLLLRGILTEISQDNISSDKVILHWFERDRVMGFSTVHSKEPDSAGRVGDWPEDFGDVELASNNEYLDAAESKLFAGKK